MADETQYDLIVIGSGPGGYVAAIRAAQLGFKVACVEKDKTLGGTCLNVGCIPSKALLESTELFHEAQHGFAGHGIKVEGVSMDLSALMQRKEKIVGSLVNGIAYLFKKNKVDWLKGLGRIKKAGLVAVEAEDGQVTEYSTQRILVATGSSPASLPNLELDGERIITSDQAIALEAVPEHLVVIGAGAIGLELGSVWKRLGAKVTVIEYLPRIMAGMDGELAKMTERILKKQGLEIITGAKVTGATNTGDGVSLTYAPVAGGDVVTIECDKLLVSVGRRPHTTGLGAEEIGLALDERGRVITNAHFETNIPGIYAIGDVKSGPMLAHKAEEEGVAAVEGMAGGYVHVNYDAIPGVVYTWPEVAAVGQTEEQLKEKGVTYRKGKFPFQANGRAKSMGHTDGFVKILADAKTDRVLGVHIVGPRAGDLIAELVLAMEFGASSEDIARTSHAHPSLAEVVKEAALAVDKRALNG